MKKGFTLVELSIVLVIIGLLIGGILAAQSMIETANVGRFVRDIDQYNIAVANFGSKYNTIPGDSHLFSPAGDGDGLIESIADNATGGGAECFCKQFTEEIANFWVHLAAGGFTLKDYSFTSTLNVASPYIDVIPPSLNLPPITSYKQAGLLAGYSNGDNAINPGLRGNIYTAADFTIGNREEKLGAFKKMFVQAVDSKMDNGDVIAGSVRSEQLTNSLYAIYIMMGSRTGGI